jgi:Flp pilus assembly protein TadG
MKKQRMQDNRRGAALVEMAIVMPLFLMIVLGIIEFGRAMMVGQMVTNAAREGARLAVVEGNSNTIVTSYVQDFLQRSLNCSGGDVSVAISITPAAGNTTSGNEVSNAQSRDLVTVTVQVPFNKVNFIPGDYLAGKNISGRATMRHE